MGDKPKGISRGLTSYGDAGFSLYLRKAFIKAMGYSDDALDRPIVGCAFAPRCTYARDRCRRESPPLLAIGPGRATACFEHARVGAEP